MKNLIQTHGGWFWKGYASVNVKDGTPLPKRTQQISGLLDRVDECPADSIELADKVVTLRKQIALWEEQAKTATVSVVQNMTVKKFYETIFRPLLQGQVESQQIAPATFQTYERQWKGYLAEHFAEMTLRSYTAPAASRYLKSCRKQDGQLMGQNSLKQRKACASGIFSEAVAQGYLAENPWKHIKLDNKVPCKPALQGHAVNEKDIELLIRGLEDARGGREDNDWTKQLAQVFLATGLYAGTRPSETVALDWSDINWTDATIHVSKAIVNGIPKAFTKTGEAGDIGDRYVPFMDELTPMLREWWILNGSPENGLIFTTADGDRPTNLNSLSSRIVKPVADKLGIKWVGFYTLRRGFATVAKLQGWTYEEVAAAMGNSPEEVRASYFIDPKTKLALAARERTRRAKQLANHDVTADVVVDLDAAEMQRETLLLEETVGQ